MARILWLVRVAVLSACTVFALIALGLSGYIVSATSNTDLYFTFSGLGVASAVLTLITLPTLLAVDILRNGLFTSRIIFELPWLSFLWILWIATAGDAVDAYNLGYPDGCIDYDRSSIKNLCQVLAAVEGFSVIIFILLLAYTCTILVFSIIARTRGIPVMMLSVKEVDFLGGHLNDISGPNTQPLTEYPQGFVPQTAQVPPPMSVPAAEV